MCDSARATDTRPNRTQPRNLQSGITVVGKGARIPTGLRIGRNCLIAADVIERDFQRFLSSNGHIARELAKRRNGGRRRA